MSSYHGIRTYLCSEHEGASSRPRRYGPPSAPCTPRARNSGKAKTPPTGATTRSRFCSDSPRGRERELSGSRPDKKRATGPYEGVARPGGDVPGANPGHTPGAPASVPIGEHVPPVPSTDTGQSIQFRALARWESAKPVRLAGGPDLPEGTAQFYVIRLRGMPLLPTPKGKDGESVPNPNEGVLEAIKQNSRLERKGKTAIPCAHLLTGSGDTATELLLFFARAADPITLDDKVGDAGKPLRPVSPVGQVPAERHDVQRRVSTLIAPLDGRRQTADLKRHLRCLPVPRFWLSLILSLRETRVWWDRLQPVNPSEARTLLPSPTLRGAASAPSSASPRLRVQMKSAR